MGAWALAAVVASAFAWGLARGTAVCLSICVPGMLPYLTEKPGGARRGLAFGAMLCAPRLVIFAVLGLVWGAASYAVFQTEAFESAARWLYVGGYLVLGAVIALVGAALFLRAARDKDRLRRARLAAATGTPVEAAPRALDERPGALSVILMRMVPSSVRGERAFVLVWGSILGFACLLEVSVIELGVLGTVSGTVATATAAAAVLGAAVMTAFAAGASVPVIVASAGFAAYVDRVRTEERLVSLRVTASLMMVAIGLILLLRYTVFLASLL